MKVPIAKEENVGINPYCHISSLVVPDRSLTEECQSCMQKELMSCYCYCSDLTGHECVDWQRLPLPLLLLLPMLMNSMMTMKMRKMVMENVFDGRVDHYELKRVQRHDEVMPMMDRLNSVFPVENVSFYIDLIRRIRV